MSKYLWKPAKEEQYLLLKENRAQRSMKKSPDNIYSKSAYVFVNRIESSQCSDPVSICVQTANEHWMTVEQKNEVRTANYGSRRPCSDIETGRFNNCGVAKKTTATSLSVRPPRYSHKDLESYFYRNLSVFTCVYLLAQNC